jgi:hypothetical protein
MHIPAHKASASVQRVQPAELPKDKKIALVLSGSCTPACDLLVMVEDGEITAHEATLALRTKSKNVSDVHSAAADEIDFMRRYDI